MNKSNRSRKFVKKKFSFYVSCNSVHGHFRAPSGVLYSFGKNKEGQLGVGNREGSLSPRVHPFFKEKGNFIKFCATGYMHTIFQTKRGKVYSAGRNTGGCLGRNIKGLYWEDIEDSPFEFDPTKGIDEDDLETLSDLEDIKTFVCGCYFNVFLLSSGSVFTSGDNRTGVLGLGDFDSRSFLTKVILPEKIQQVAAGVYVTDTVYSNHFSRYHTLFLGNSGFVYGAGSNIDENPMRGEGRLGISSTSIPQQILLNEHLHPTNQPKLKKVLCASTHSVFLTREGNFYVTGQNEFGELGLGHNKTLRSPQINVELSNAKIVDFKVGGRFNMFSTEDGKFLTCGNGRFGRLGLGNVENVKTPVPIKRLENYEIIDYYAGGSQSYFITKNLVVLGCGKSNYGELFTEKAIYDVNLKVIGKDFFEEKRFEEPEAKAKMERLQWMQEALQIGISSEDEAFLICIMYQK